MKLKFVSILFAVSFSLSAHSAVFDLTASIDGIQSGSGSLGTGFATMTYDDVSGVFSWNIAWSDLTGTVTAAHFHGPALPGMDAFIRVDFGSISGLSSPSVGSTVIDETRGNNLLSGLWYINIHTTTFPGGEIRGQVNVAPVPVPGAMLLMLSAIGGLGFWRRSAT